MLSGLIAPSTKLSGCVAPGYLHKLKESELHMKGWASSAEGFLSQNTLSKELGVERCGSIGPDMSYGCLV